MAEAAARGGRAGSRPSRPRTVQPTRRHAKPTKRPAKKPGRLARLRVVPQADAPHGRLGVLWAVPTVAAVVAGPVVLAVWMAAHAGLAGLQAARSWPKSKAPNPVAVGIGAVLVPLGCAFGLPGAVVGLAVGGAVAAGLSQGQAVGRAVTIALALGAAAGSLVVARTVGVVPGLFLLGLVCAYDTGSYLVGTGAGSAWEGPAAGIAAMGPVTLLGATLAVPPFSESGPWIAGGLAALLAPVGPYAGSALLGSKKTRVPAVRRLDALLVLGPVWAVAAAVLTA